LVNQARSLLLGQLAALRFDAARPGPTVVALHGFTQHRFDLARSLRAAEPGPWGTLWLLDAPGHGSSGQVGFTGLAHALRLLGDDVVLVGYSMGARLALWYAATVAQPPRGVVALSGHLGIAEPAARAVRARADEERAAELESLTDARPLGARGDDMRGFLARWNALGVFAGRALGDLERDSRLRSSPKGLAHALRLLGTARQPVLDPLLAARPVPLLYLAGARDATYVAMAERVRALPGAEVRIVPEAGHDLLHDAPDVVRDALARFLAEPDHRSP
jgi:2-succinyl-6-hydroxy-2,4-cyclohexadiene-1-carboxylate synthase